MLFALRSCGYKVLASSAIQNSPSVQELKKAKDEDKNDLFNLWLTNNKAGRASVVR